MLHRIIIVCCIALLGACGGGPGTEKWCAEKKAQPKGEWSMEDAKTYAAKCVVESTTIGSEAWCEKMKAKDKGDLTMEEAADITKHCII